MALSHVVSKRLPKIIGAYKSLVLCKGMSMGYELYRKPGSTLSINELHVAIRKYLRDLLNKGQILITETENSIGITLPKIHSISMGYLAQKENISLEDSLAIAHSKRDIGFLTRARFVGCPVNADSACKRFVAQKRGKISLLPCARGVVDIIEYFTG
jgi:hypothetical protein